MNKFYVYELSDTNNVPFYIGKGMIFGKYNRIAFHKNHWQHNNNKKLKNKIKKLGGVFNTKILFTSNIEKECLDLEINLIKQISRERLCNLTDGGEGVCGYNHTKNTKRKMSILAKTPERLQIAINNAKIASSKNIGKRKLLKYHDKILELYSTHTIREISNELDISFYTIKKYLEEQGWYIPNKNRKPLSYEARQMRADTIRKIQRNKSQPVLQFTRKGEFIKEFPNAPEACDVLHKFGRSSEITTVCLGKRHTAFGYIWEYKKT